MTTDITLFCLRKTIILQADRQLDAIPLGVEVEVDAEGGTILMLEPAVL